MSWSTGRTNGVGLGVGSIVDVGDGVAVGTIVAVGGGIVAVDATVAVDPAVAVSATPLFTVAVPSTAPGIPVDVAPAGTVEIAAAVAVAPGVDCTSRSRSGPLQAASRLMHSSTTTAISGARVRMAGSLQCAVRAGRQGRVRDDGYNNTRRGRVQTWSSFRLIRVLEASGGFEPPIRLLQSPALPLGYDARTFGSIAHRPASPGPPGGSRSHPKVLANRHCAGIARHDRQCQQETSRRLFGGTLRVPFEVVHMSQSRILRVPATVQVTIE